MTAGPRRELDTLGGYEILYAIKSGGMGDVLLARKLGAGGFERLVAIKTIKAELRARAELRAMFLDEAKLLARLSHPCIAQVFDFGEEEDGTLFLAMEYVAGVRFTELARRDTPPGIAARAMGQVCRGLQAAHELTDLDGHPLGVVHRDVTPENLMLTYEGRVKVLDFGIALVRGRTAPVTEYGTIKGKPPYLSPEQVKNEAVDRRTDIFSAAVVLHELLTGEPVYQGESVYAIARAIETADVPPPSEALGEPLPDGLDDVVMSGMQRDPEERFQNAQAMAEALERVATSAGAESLEAFARRELAEDQEEHRAWLRRLMSTLGAPDADVRGRPSGVMTALPGEPAVQVEMGDPEPPAGSTDDELRLLEGTRSRRGMWRLLLLLLLAGGGIAVFVLTQSGDREQLAAAPADAMPPPPDAAPDPPDAAIALAPPPDAAPSPPDAKTRVVRTPPVRKRADAAPVVVRRQPPDAAPPPPPTGTATLTIVADPYVTVRIDGEELGGTPLFRHQVPAGKREVVLVDPESGAVLLRRTYDLRDRDHRRIEGR